MVRLAPQVVLPEAGAPEAEAVHVLVVVAEGRVAVRRTLQCSPVRWATIFNGRPQRSCSTRPDGEEDIAETEYTVQPHVAGHPYGQT